MEMGINFQSNNNKSVLIMKVREARSELHGNDDSDSEFTAADEAIKVSTCGLLCNKVHNEKPFDASTYMYSDDMSTFFVFIDFDLRQKLILLVHLLFLSIFHVLHWFSASSNQKCVRLCVFSNVNVIIVYYRNL